jgi:uncharacterized protein YceH (UPF0502 family)
VSRIRKLDPVEVRVLGVLLEKEQATPDQYPLTTHAVVAGANQKTNREPVTDLTETDVTEALDRLREDVLAWRTQTSRAERWEQRLDRRWELDAASKAVMTLLLLRGPQTPGELRSRAERLHSFATVDEVEATLGRLAGGFDPLVRELSRRPGQREARWAHLASAQEPEAELAEAAPRPAESAEAQAEPRPRTGAEERLENLAAEVAELRQTVAALARQLRELRAELGVE